MNLVTGGGGFLGSHLVLALLDAGEAVRVLEHPKADVEHLPLDRIELVHADIRDASSLQPAVQGCQRVYHLAADPNLWSRDPAQFDAVNHQGTLNVIRAALESGVERILHTTTESILAQPGKHHHAVETLRLDEASMIGPYCLSKFRAEEAVFKMMDEGAPIVMVCPTLPVGPGDRRLTPPTRMTLAFCRGELPAFIECRLNLIDARDVAKGMMTAMRRGRSGIRYLLGGENHPLSDWLRILGEVCDQSVPRFRVPYPVALGAAWFSEQWANHVTGEMPLATVTGVRLSRRSMYFDPSASLKELGLKPRTIQESAHDAVVWYRAEGMI